MPFPESSRIIYNKNPLDKVICQLRFPPILKIEKGLPADFQEAIRKEFPVFSETKEFSYDLPTPQKDNGDERQPNPETIKNILFQPPIENKNYSFSSEDDIWKINLTRNFIALSANKYERWEKFKEKLLLPLKTLVNIYDPAYFTRIGLRYVDIIQRSLLGLESDDWDDLIQPYILGLLSEPNIKGAVDEFESRYSLSLAENKGKVRILIKSFIEPNTSESCYMIDSDFFCESKTNIGDEIDCLDFFNTRASRLIQWCIKSKLHDAMEPKEIQ